MVAMGISDWENKLSTERARAADEASRKAREEAELAHQVQQARREAAGMPEFARWFVKQAEAAGLRPASETYVRRSGRRDKRVPIAGWWAVVETGDGTEDRGMPTKRVFMTADGSIFDREHDVILGVGPITGPLRPLTDVGERGGYHFGLRVPRIQAAMITLLARGR